MHTFITEKFIYDESSMVLFYDKLDNFEKYFIDDMLMFGVAKNGSNIFDIDFEHHKKHGELFYGILKEGIRNTIPFLTSEVIINNRREMQCQFYNFGESKGQTFLYMLKNAMDWNDKSDFCCQLFSLIEPNEETILNFWST